MRTGEAVIRTASGEYETTDLIVADPEPGQIRFQARAAGLCHCDDHAATGDLTVGVYPFAGGHQEAGVVIDAPLNDKGIVEGDHVVCCFVPYGKRLHGSLFGACSASSDIPRQIELHRHGLLKLDELITRTYQPDQIAQAYRDLHAGPNLAER